MSLKRFVASTLVAVLALAASAGVARAAEKAQPAGKINVNTATAEQLTQLPGVGERLAARIVEHREKEGPFKSAQELMNVKGIGERNFQKLQPYLSVGEPAARAATR